MARRKVLFALVTVLGGTLLALVVAELYVRFKPPMPPTQIIRRNELATVGDVPVWQTTGPERLRHFKCPVEHPERRIVVFLGDSITAGSFVDPKDNFTQQLETQLNAQSPKPGFCVMNLAAAGYHFDQKLAVLEEFLTHHHPDLVMWQVWSTERFPYRLLGDAAYSIDDWTLRADGFPGIRFVPDAINRFLFTRSRLYQYLDISLASRGHDAVDPVPHEMQFFGERLSKLLALAREKQLRLAFFLAPPLDWSFRETAAEGALGWQTRYARYVEAAGFSAYPLQRELVDEDYLALRFDPCCHFNVTGQKVLARVFERLVLEQLGRAPRAPD